jgi:hypothetical protein
MPIWASCPVCGRSFSTVTPGQPCSSGCAARQAIDRAKGRNPDPVAPVYRGGDTPRRGQQQGPGPAPKGKDGCLKSLVIGVAGAAGLAAAAAELVRHLVA